MSRRLTSLLTALALLPAASSLARAQGSRLAAVPLADGTTGEATLLDATPGAELEVGPRLGVAVGLGGQAPGGLRVGGAFRHLLTERLWLDAEGAFSGGSPARGCMAQPDGELTCDRGAADGFAVSALVGVRYPLRVQPSGFAPYVRGGGGLAWMRFPHDEVTGFWLPLWGGLGGRFAVAEGVNAGAELLFLAGPAALGHGLGAEPAAGLLVQGAVDFGM